MSSELRNLLIKGSAADDYTKTKTGGRRRGGGTRKVTQEGGDVPPGLPISSPVNMQKGMNMANKIGQIIPPAPLPVPAPVPVPVSVPVPLPAISKGGAASPSGVVLAPKKKTKSRIVLAPPAHYKRRAHHNTRKIRVQLSGLKKRLTRAKSIHKESKEKPILDIRKILEEAKLVKPVSDGKKVPDSVLRDIYRDYCILRQKAL